jgi:hypothetical protein
MHVKSGESIQKQELQKYNIDISEHNQSFLHQPRIRSAGFSDLGKPTPNTEPNTALPDPSGPQAQGRGNKLDISV